MNGAAIQWVGKAVGGLVGFAVAGPLAALVGVLVGHQFDEGFTQRLRTRFGGPQQMSPLFFELLFEVMGSVAKVDGRVSEDEIRVARGIMRTMRLSAEHVREAIARFTLGKAVDYPLERRLAELAAQIGGRAELARAFVHVQLQAAVGAGQIDSSKRQLLWRVASALDVSRAEVAQIEAIVRGYHAGARGSGGRSAREAAAPSLDEAYRALGVAPSASDADVKTAYRRLMNQHHPDKVAARGLPESMVGIAQRKTHEVRAAYEKIRASRGLK